MEAEDGDESDLGNKVSLGRPGFFFLHVNSAKSLASGSALYQAATDWF